MERHGMSRTRIYSIWRDMRHRCSCEGMKNYRHYGGRGIRVCQQWNESFLAFYEWAIANGYLERLTIDRIDVNGNYFPENCRWVEKGIQSANRRSTGECEYIGVFMHSNGSCYNCSIKKDNKVIFSYASRSKNDCAIKRNEFIVRNNLPYPLNEIKDCYEDVRKHKNDFIYTATRKNNGEIYQKIKLKDLAVTVGLTPEFIHQCIAGTRNSKGFVFEKRCLYEQSFTA